MAYCNENQEIDYEKLIKQVCEKNISLESQAGAKDIKQQEYLEILEKHIENLKIYEEEKGENEHLEAELAFLLELQEQAELEKQDMANKFVEIEQRRADIPKKFEKICNKYSTQLQEIDEGYAKMKEFYDPKNLKNLTLEANNRRATYEAEIEYLKKAKIRLQHILENQINLPKPKAVFQNVDPLYYSEELTIFYQNKLKELINQNESLTKSIKELEK